MEKAKAILERKKQELVSAKQELVDQRAAQRVCIHLTGTLFRKLDIDM